MASGDMVFSGSLPVTIKRAPYTVSQGSGGWGFYDSPSSYEAWWYSEPTFPNPTSTYQMSRLRPDSETIYSVSGIVSPASAYAQAFTTKMMTMRAASSAGITSFYTQVVNFGSPGSIAGYPNNYITNQPRMHGVPDGYTIIDPRTPVLLEGRIVFMVGLLDPGFNYWYGLLDYSTGDIALGTSWHTKTNRGFTADCIDSLNNQTLTLQNNGAAGINIDAMRFDAGGSLSWPNLVSGSAPSLLALQNADAWQGIPGVGWVVLSQGNAYGESSPEPNGSALFLIAFDLSEYWQYVFEPSGSVNQNGYGYYGPAWENPIHDVISFDPDGNLYYVQNEGNPSALAVYTSFVSAPVSRKLIRPFRLPKLYCSPCK